MGTHKHIKMRLFPGEAEQINCKRRIKEKKKRQNKINMK